MIEFRGKERPQVSQHRREREECLMDFSALISQLLTNNASGQRVMKAPVVLEDVKKKGQSVNAFFVNGSSSLLLTSTLTLPVLALEREGYL